MASQCSLRTAISLIITICALLSVVLADAAASGVQLTETELKQYDGTDSEKPIYLAINGTIFDVSASPAFYGPGGHYHHFTGKDASRAWVTECWDSEDQLTWRMDGLETMFMPKYLDEQFQQAADGESDIEGAAAFGQAEMARMANVVLGKYGKVTEKAKKKRRAADTKEAEQKVQDGLAHWVSFFANNDKYKIVGSVIYDKDKPEPPEICKAAMDKRPHKGGILDDLMKKAGAKGGIFEGEKKPAVPTEAMPDFVKEALKNRGLPVENVHEQQVEEDDLVKDEL